MLNVKVEEGAVIVENVNPATKAPISFSYKSDNALKVSINDLHSLLESLNDEKTKEAVNKQLKKHMGVKFDIKLSEFGAESESAQS